MLRYSRPAWLDLLVVFMTLDVVLAWDNKGVKSYGILALFGFLYMSVK